MCFTCRACCAGCHTCCCCHGRGSQQGWRCQQGHPGLSTQARLNNRSAAARSIPGFLVLMALVSNWHCTYQLQQLSSVVGRQHDTGYMSVDLTLNLVRGVCVAQTGKKCFSRGAGGASRATRGSALKRGSTTGQLLVRVLVCLGPGEQLLGDYQDPLQQLALHLPRCTSWWRGEAVGAQQ